MGILNWELSGRHIFNISINCEVLESGFFFWPQNFATLIESFSNVLTAALFPIRKLPIFFFFCEPFKEFRHMKCAPIGLNTVFLLPIDIWQFSQKNTQTQRAHTSNRFHWEKTNGHANKMWPHKSCPLYTFCLCSIYLCIQLVNHIYAENVPSNLKFVGF